MANYTTTPTWTDNVAVTNLGPTTVAFGGMTRGTIDLRGKAGAYLFAWIGRKGATGLSANSGIVVEARRVLAPAAATVGGVSGSVASWRSETAASTATAVAVTSAASGTGSTVGVTSGAGFLAGDIICIYDAAFTRLEFARISKVATNTLTLDAPLQFSHTSAQADNVTRLAERFGPVFLPGGSLYELIFDYGLSTVGSDVVVMAKAQTYDSDSSVSS